MTDQPVGDLTDYLQGLGNFSTRDVELSWTLTSTDFTETIIDSQNEKALQLSRVSGQISFGDGFTVPMNSSAQPQHLRFFFASANKEIEDTNLRLKDSNTDRTAVSFRCGYAGFVRVNDNQMVMFYNNSLSTNGVQYWSKADIILDWSQKAVTIYINDTYQGTANFYHEEVTSVNLLQLYNLNSGTTSWWKDIQVCKYRCASNIHTRYIIDFISSQVLQFLLTSLILLLIFI